MWSLARIKSNRHFFFEPDPSAPSSYLRSARLPSATSALGCTPGTLASRRLENSLRTSSFRYFSSGYTLRKKTSKPRIRAEMLVGLGGCRESLHYQGLSYVPQTIRIELTSGLFWHRENSRTCCQKILLGLQSLPIPAHCVRAPDLQSLPIPTQPWKDLSMDYATGLPYLRIGKELSVDFKTRLLMFTNWKGTSYDSILAIVDRLIKMILPERTFIPGLRHSKSFSAGPLRLRAWIWLLMNLIPA